MKNNPIAVLGTGAWGSALAVHLANNNQTVHFWSNDLEALNSIRENQTNPKFYPLYYISTLAGTLWAKSIKWKKKDNSQIKLSKISA